MPTNLAALVPNTKFETEKASALVQLGYPEIKAVIPQILEWLQDLNWPVSNVFQPLLVDIGEPLAPYVRSILLGQGDSWKYSLLAGVISQSPELAQALRSELERMAKNPSAGESKEEVDQVAREILGAISGGTTEA